MTRRRSARALLAVPRAVVTFVGLCAVIVGILAMHVWMGGHGPAAHGAAVPTGPAATLTELHTAADGGHPAHEHAQHEGASAGSADSSGMEHGCLGHCEDGAALGLCALALIVVTVLAFLLPAGRVIPWAMLSRGPPRLHLRPLAIPVPSLTRLCISRT